MYDFSVQIGRNVSRETIGIEFNNQVCVLKHKRKKVVILLKPIIDKVGNGLNAQIIVLEL